MIAIRKRGGWKPFGTPQRPQNHGKTATEEADQDADHDDEDDGDDYKILTDEADQKPDHDDISNRNVHKKDILHKYMFTHL